MGSDVVEEGDDVLLYLDERRQFLVKVVKGKELHTHKGYVKADDIIGKRYGGVVTSHMGAKFYILRPTLKDYVRKFARRTQIIYPKDMGIIVSFSNIGPGSIVVEAGTGSGALTCFLAYHVRPSGKVYSYEIRQEFLERARENIKRAGLEKYVELKLKDIAEGIDERDVDAVVLDMPTPWLVVPQAYAALKGCGFFVSFSPTINQVERTVVELRRNGFVDVRAVEVIVRSWQAEEGRMRPRTLDISHTGYLVFARKALLEEER